MRVHVLVDSLWAGGAELLVADFGRVAGTVGIDLTVSALQGDRDSPAAVRLRESGIEAQVIPVRSLWRPGDVRRVAASVAEARPQLVHTHLGYADVLGGRAARQLGIPSISTIHADYWGGGLRRRARYRAMARARRRCAELVVAVSESAREAYLAQGWDKPDRLVVVRNGISLTARPGSGRAVREELSIPPDALVVTMISRVAHEKGHDVAIEAVEELRRVLGNVHLVVVGEGAYLEEVERLGERLGDALRITGHREDVMDVLDASDVLLQPSRFDAFPTTLLEAMEASVPVVATAVGGIPEMVEDGVSGVLTEPPPDASRISAALGRLLEDRARRLSMGSAGRERRRAEFSAAAWAQRTRALYDQVVDGRDSSR